MLDIPAPYRSISDSVVDREIEKWANEYANSFVTETECSMLEWRMLREAFVAGANKMFKKVPMQNQEPKPDVVKNLRES